MPLSDAILQTGRTNGTETGGADDVEVTTIWTGDVICSGKNAGGVRELACIFSHACTFRSW